MEGCTGIRLYLYRSVDHFYSDPVFELVRSRTCHDDYENEGVLIQDRLS